MTRLLSGIKPTGDLTLGNYIGALKQFVKMQDEYDDVFVFIADLHAITVSNEPEELRKKIKDVAAIYLACGLDPKKVTLYIQSENPYHTVLAWILECHSYLGELSRMTQFKDKSSKLKEQSMGCGLFTYPVLMASDIILYDADVVPVGEDQKQHVELTRNLAERFNNKYGETFKVPNPVIPKAGARIKDLQDPTKKMSKSDENDKGCIILLEDLEITRKKVMSAVTDSDMTIKYDEENKPGISNLITIYSVLTGKTVKDIEIEFKNSNYGTFKKAVADAVVATLEPIQAKYKELINSKELDDILDAGNKKTTAMAKAKCDIVMKKVGLGR